MIRDPVANLDNNRADPLGPSCLTRFDRPLGEGRGRPRILQKTQGLPTGRLGKARGRAHVYSRRGMLRTSRPIGLRQSA